MGNVVSVDTHKIRERMKELRKSLQDISDETGLSKAYVRQLIAGYVPQYWRPRFNEIAKAIDLPVKEIVSEQSRRSA